MFDLDLDATNPIPFVMVDATGVEVAGLGDTFVVTVRKNGGSFGASAGAKAELADGWYLYTATASECDTAGPLALKVTGAGCAQQNLVYRVTGIQTEISEMHLVVDDIYDELVLGAGLIPFEYAVYSSVDGVTPLAGVRVRVTTDAAGQDFVSENYTDALGKVVFHLDAGTYYMWRYRDLTSFVNPDIEIIS